MTQWKRSWKQMKNNESSVLPVLRALGLCAKARRLIVGTAMICEALRAKQKPYLVVAACDNGPNTQKKLSDKCASYGVRLERVAASGEALGAAVGKSGAVAAVAVTDENLCRLVETALQKI